MGKRRIGSTRAPLADRKDDFYASPEEAVLSFLALEKAFLPRVIVEPACGDGAIVMPMREAGYKVFASDLVDRGCPDSLCGIDFLMPCDLPTGVFGIVTNPPFKLSKQFIDKSLDICPYVAVLMRLVFLEGVARIKWFERTGLSRVYVSSRRLPRMHRHGWNGKKAGSSTCFAWFVWDQTWRGDPVVRWFDWKQFMPQPVIAETPRLITTNAGPLFEGL